MRITGGALRGRSIRQAPGTRPSAERLREALFSRWQGVVAGAGFLDLCCGSAAMALEALSRGGGRAVAVDADRRSLETAGRNAADLGLALTLVRGRVPGVLRQPRLLELGPFDLVFVDPPYAFALEARDLQAIAALLATDGRLAIEHDRRRALPAAPALLQSQGERDYGDSRLSFYVRSRSESPPSSAETSSR